MAQLWHKLAQDRRLIHILIIICTSQLLIIALLGFLLSDAVKERRCFGVNGISSGHLQSSVVPEPIVFDFAYRIWQGINYWPKNGESDYQANIDEMRAYLTSQFKSQLEKDYHVLLKSGELRDRERALILDDLKSDETNVIPIGNNRWQVTLVMQVLEHIGKHKVKNIKMSYPIIVEKRDVSIDANQWGLAIAGFTKQPHQLEVMG